MDTIRNIFEGNRVFSKALEIGRDDAGYDWQAFPVIRFSFNGYSSDPLLFEERLFSALNEISDERELATGKILSASGLSDVIDKLSKRHPPWRNPGLDPERTEEPMNVVLLKDEYDFPMISNLGNPEGTERLRSISHDFCSSIESCHRNLQISMVTGVNKFDQLSFSSTMNNFKDLSQNKQYSTLAVSRRPR